MAVILCHNRILRHPHVLRHILALRTGILYHHDKCLHLIDILRQILWLHMCSSNHNDHSLSHKGRQVARHHRQDHLTHHGVLNHNSLLRPDFSLPPE